MVHHFGVEVKIFIYFWRCPPTPLYNIALRRRAPENLGAAGEMVHHLGFIGASRLNIIRGRGRGEEALHFENAVTRCSPGQPQVVHHFANVPLNSN